jgi:hypothetical protein
MEKVIEKNKFLEDVEVFIDNENWDELNALCREMRRGGNLSDISLLKSAMEQNVARRKPPKNAYFIADNIELLKNILYLETDGGKIEEYRELFRENIKNLANYRTSDADMEFTVIVAISKLATGDILDNDASLKLLRRNGKKITNFIANHNFALEYFTPGETLCRVKLNNIRDEMFVMEKKYGIRESDQMDGLLLRARFGDNRTKDCERYIKLGNELRKAESIFYKIKNSNLANMTTQIAQELAGVFAVHEGNGALKNFLLKKFGRDLAIGDGERKNITGVLMMLVRKAELFLFFLYKKARSLDRATVDNTLRDGEYHLERKKNMKNGRSDPFGKKFFNFINRFSMLFNVVFRASENKKETVELPDNLKENLDNFYEKKSIGARLREEAAAYEKNLNNLNNLEAIIKNRRLKHRYGSRMQNLSGKMGALQREVKKVRSVRLELMSAKEKMKNMEALERRREEHAEIEKKLRELGSEVEESVGYHLFLAQCQRDGNIEELLDRECELENSGERPFKNAEFCNIFIQKIYYFSINFEKMRGNEDFKIFEKKILDEVETGLQKLINHCIGEKSEGNMKNIRTICEKIFAASQNDDAVGNLLRKKEKEFNAVVEESGNQKIRRISTYCLFLEKYYYNSNGKKEAPAGFWNSLFGTSRDKNFDRVIKINLKKDKITKADLDAIAEWIEFIYLNYNDMRKDPNFDKFSARIQNDFCGNLSALADYVQKNKTEENGALLQSILNIQQSNDNPLGDALKKTRESVEKSLGEDVFEQIDEAFNAVFSFGEQLQNLEKSREKKGFFRKIRNIFRQKKPSPTEITENILKNMEICANNFMRGETARVEIENINEKLGELNEAVAELRDSATDDNFGSAIVRAVNDFYEILRNNIGDGDKYFLFLREELENGIKNNANRFSIGGKKREISKFSEKETSELEKEEKIGEKADAGEKMERKIGKFEERERARNLEKTKNLGGAKIGALARARRKIFVWGESANL